MIISKQDWFKNFNKVVVKVSKLTGKTKYEVLNDFSCWQVVCYIVKQEYGCDTYSSIEFKEWYNMIDNLTKEQIENLI